MHQARSITDFSARYAMNDIKKGALYALVCYLIWGVFPLFWYPLNQSDMPSIQILAQRIVWSAVFAGVLLTVFRQWREVVQAALRPKILGIFTLTAVLVAINWLVYLWAILNGHVLDASLGYFINPLVNVLLGFVFLREKLNRLHVLALCLAAGGIVRLAVPAGQIPWISIVLAASFGLYGLIRKTAPMPALAGLALETFILAPVALGYLLLCFWGGTLYFSQLNALQTSVLLLSGAATTIPLLLFAEGAKRIPLSLLGMLQYVSPTLQLLLGIVMFHEPLNGARLTGYALVWLGVAVFLTGSWRAHRLPQRATESHE